VEESYIAYLIICTMSVTESSLVAFMQKEHAGEDWWMENLKYRFIGILLRQKQKYIASTDYLPIQTKVN
jgi:hypothetical protein